MIDELQYAYTLLCSVEPALIRAVKQSPNETALYYNEQLLEKVREWTEDYRKRRQESIDNGDFV